MIKTIEINHISLHVESLAISLAFYKDVLGLTEKPRPAFDFPGAWLKINDRQEIHLIEGRNHPVHSDSRGTHFAIQVASLKEAEQWLTQHQANFRPPKPRPDGIQQIFVKDPDGYSIELFELGIRD